VRYALGLAFLLIAVAIVFVAARWIEENYVSRPDPIQPVGPFHYPGYRQTAENAVLQFSKLSATEQVALRKNLEQNIVSVERWFDWVRGSGVKVMCLGEDHEDATRQFLARTLFSELDIDLLLLEATPHQLGLITQELTSEQELSWEREPVSLLDADIAGIIRAARLRNPDVELIGIEETKRQRIARQKNDRPGTRDESIHNNFWRHFRYGRRYVLLFGALHCTNRVQWLYGRTRRLAPRRVANEMINVRILEEHQDGRVEAFVYFLGKIGIRRGDFVVVDSKKLHPLIYEWFESLGVTLKDFTALIIFGDRSQKSNS
jgi:hypothetical protein